MAREPILKIVDVVKKFGELMAVDHCFIDFEPGSITGLIGPNGAGKTTLFNLITGVLRPDSGQIYFKGERDHAERSRTKSPAGESFEPTSSSGFSRK